MSEQDRVYQLFDEFVAARERGDPCNADHYAARLTSEVERTEFRELVGAIANVEADGRQSLAPGSLLADRYRLLRQLGQGGMGRVFLARDEKSDRQLAVKVLEFDDPHFDPTQMLRRERRALARLRHPNIVTFLDADIWKGQPYLVMDYVPGRSLGEVLSTLRQARPKGDRSRAPDLADLKAAIGHDLPVGGRDLVGADNYYRAVARIVHAVASALECAHAADVVHRDIKAANILMRGGGFPVLLDFGLASLVDATRGKMTSMLVGTPNYVAPEQIVNWRAGSDPRTDVYQLGAVLYELLTQTVLWGDEPEDQVVSAILDKTPMPPRAVQPSVPRELDAICSRAMCRDPKQRYQTARALRLDLGAYIEGKVLPEAIRLEASVMLRLRYAIRRRSWILPLVLVAVALIVWRLLT